MSGAYEEPRGGVWRPKTRPGEKKAGVHGEKGWGGLGRTIPFPL